MAARSSAGHRDEPPSLIPSQAGQVSGPGADTGRPQVVKLRSGRRSSLSNLKRAGPAREEGPEGNLKYKPPGGQLEM